MDATALRQNNGGRMNKFKQSNESRITQAELREKLVELLTLAEKNHCAVAGFVWGVDPPVMMRFGNVPQQGQDLTRLFVLLCNTAEEKAEKGLLINDRVPVSGISKEEHYEHDEYDGEEF
jgi:hypothetical protein